MKQITNEFKIPEELKLPSELKITHLFVCLIIGISIGTLITYKAMVNDHVRLYKSNIGYFVFKDNKVYNLSELKNI